MKGTIFLVLNLVISAASPPGKPNVFEIGEGKDIAEANKERAHDDILENPQRSSITNPNILWESPVPYVLDKNLDMNAKGLTLRAFEQFRLKSCIDFKPWGSEEYYISVQKEQGCYSYIGRVISNGQVLSIGQYCDEISTVEHEFLHALGFFHEQSRSDRDDHVIIVFDNILKGREGNFRIQEKSNTHGVPYDYVSVMHYGKDAFSNGNGSTIITKDPQFQDVIGQRIEMSPSDVKELNLLYQCNSSVSFMMYCGFHEDNMCQMSQCSQSGTGWERVLKVPGGPSSDHTTLPSGTGQNRQGEGYFMHASTASIQEGDSAWLETPRMKPKRTCDTQCLQFYYYHTGSDADMLNIWIREFSGEQDHMGSLRLMGQITGAPTSHWKLHHVSLDSAMPFQIEFEVRKGVKRSGGGFSIDDINLSETECPHVIWQIDDFENFVESSSYSTLLYSPTQYTTGGYAYRSSIVVNKPYVGLYVQLLSGKNDDKLQWPLANRQITYQVLDQNPTLQLQMTKQISIVTDPTKVDMLGNLLWDDPRKNGDKVLDENNQTVYAGPLIGRTYFMNLEKMEFREYLKGGSGIFAFDFQDISPLDGKETLPCPSLRPVTITHPVKVENRGPCSARTMSTTAPPPPPATTDDSIFSFSPAAASSPVLVLLLSVMLLIR